MNKEEVYPLDWAYQPKHRGRTERFFRAVGLWLAIVGRTNQADYRTGPYLAWEIARYIHRECICWGCKRYADVPDSGWRRA